MSRQRLISARRRERLRAGVGGQCRDWLRHHGILGGRLGDRATVRRTREPGVSIAAIRGVVDDLPMEAARNTAGRALQAMHETLSLPFGLQLELDKGIPLASGLGGSAASAVAAVVAANARAARIPAAGSSC